MDLSELQGRAVVITGASRGIGAAAARAFAEAGCSVLLAARSTDQCKSIAEEINAAGGSAFATACDVSHYEQVAAAVAACQEQFGRFDILINNAGVIDPIGLSVDADPKQWSHAVDINLKGTFYGVHAALQVFQPQGQGVIINVSSGAAHHPLEGWSHYCAAKAGSAMVTRTIHMEAARKGIRILGLSPGTVATDMQIKIKDSGINPISQMNPEEHIPASWPAKALLWMCTDDAREYDGQDVKLSELSIRQKLGLPSQH
ncbi:MAG: SDR family oxidoreductase [Granulosicoccaceae bacterium]